MWLRTSLLTPVVYTTTIFKYLAGNKENIATKFSHPYTAQHNKYKTINSSPYVQQTFEEGTFVFIEW